MSDERDIVQRLKDDAAGMRSAATEQPDYYAVLGVYAMTCSEAADEIERLRGIITAWCDAMDAEWEASYDELASAVTDRMDAEKYLRAAVGR